MEKSTEIPAEVGKGSRRVCLRIPGTDLCLKRYRDDDNVGATVRREIARGRFSRRLNTCAQEYDYFQTLKTKLSQEMLSVFPEKLELKYDDKFGWHLVESLVLNGDGSVPEKFARVYRRASSAQQMRLYAEFCGLMRTFEEAGVRFYDPQNVIVQWSGKPFEGNEFRLRIVDFEPVSRAFLPLDMLAPTLCRMKLRRRVRRFVRDNLHRKYNPLPMRERKAWDDCVAKAGSEMGLSSCKALLENKLVNDIFYEGLFNGRPCMVKCSSRAPSSIENEYELAFRLHSMDPVHFPRVYAVHLGPRAFVVTEKIEGGKSLQTNPDDRYADDVLAILDSLAAANVVHRDILPANFLIAPDGHLKLIDFQFAVDMNTKRVDPWLARRPLYHFLVFAAIVSSDGARWDDAEFARGLLPALRERARSRVGRLRLEIPFSFVTRLRLRLAGVVMRVQRLFARKGSRKLASLDRRLERLR